MERNMDIRLKNSTFWKYLPWKEFQVNTFRLQCKIYNAMRQGNIQQTLKLQKMLIASASSYYIAVRYITQLNAGKRIPGIDGKLLNTPNEKVECVIQIRETFSHWDHSSLRRVWVRTGEGEKSLLGIPNIEDRIIQYIWRLALEPSHEALFFSNSYGFRPGKTAWDGATCFCINLQP